MLSVMELIGSLLGNFVAPSVTANISVIVPLAIIQAIVAISAPATEYIIPTNDAIT
jgi:hypothetical protein